VARYWKDADIYALTGMVHPLDDSGHTKLQKYAFFRESPRIFANRLKKIASICVIRGFLSYSKRDVLIQQVHERVRAHNRKAEVENMKQTIAEALIAEGKELASIEVAIKTKQEVLMTLLQTKFGQLPNHISERIQNVSEIERLNILNRFVTANSLVQRGGNHSLVNASSSDPSRPPSVLVRSIGLRESPRPTRGGD
jgi:seryl-tRNA synthetase